SCFREGFCSAGILLLPCSIRAFCPYCSLQSWVLSSVSTAAYGCRNSCGSPSAISENNLSTILTHSHHGKNVPFTFRSSSYGSMPSFWDGPSCFRGRTLCRGSCFPCRG